MIYCVCLDVVCVQCVCVKKWIETNRVALEMGCDGAKCGGMKVARLGSDGVRGS